MPILMLSTHGQAKRGKDLRLVVMSATLDAAKFIKYFPNAKAAYLRVSRGHYHIEHSVLFIIKYKYLFIYELSAARPILNRWMSTSF